MQYTVRDLNQWADDALADEKQYQSNPWRRRFSKNYEKQIKSIADALVGLNPSDEVTIIENRSWVMYKDNRALMSSDSDIFTVYPL